MDDAQGVDEESHHPTEETVWGTEDSLALTFTRRYQRDWRYIAPPHRPYAKATK